LDSLAPAIFTADSSGQGLPAAVTLRQKADGSQIYEEVFTFDQGLNKLVPRPIDLGPDMGPSTDQVFLILFGTGIRNRNSLFNVRAGIGGANSEVLFASGLNGFEGLDQVNLRIPRSLAGRNGSADVVLSVDNKAANIVQVTIK
jgi:uncharacterized protein (TIGR03437 family)